MPAKESDRAARLLLRGLDSLPERDRAYVLRAILSGVLSGHGIPGRTTTVPLRPSVGEAEAGELYIEGPWSGGRSQASRQVDHPLLVRLPSDLHGRLRRWSTDHGFSMAGVVRGLVERFLDEQAERSPGRRT